MADTRVQLEVEAWVRNTWLPQHLGLSFEAKRLQLESGGFFEFDAVSPKGEVVATISTSAAKTANGKLATGAVMKHRSDMLFLLMVPAGRRLLVLTNRTMELYWERQRARGRVPTQIEVLYAELPAELEEKLMGARSRSSAEMLQPSRSVSR
jgi:hypothetical protein